MPTTAEIAHQIIGAYAEARSREHVIFMSYNEAAKRIGHKGQHQQLGAVWEKVYEICERDGLPDIAACIVNLYSLTSGQLKPSEQVLDRHGGWPGVRKQQAAVITYDWEDWLAKNMWR
ncbi:MAG: hypothetical protein AAGG56_14175 [Pseudomonadota bacterium]